MPDNSVHCSFCLKGAAEVAKIIEGPGTYIRGDCVGLCVQILEGPVLGDGSVELPTWESLDDTW